MTRMVTKKYKNIRCHLFWAKFINFIAKFGPLAAVITIILTIGDMKMSTRLLALSGAVFALLLTVIMCIRKTGVLATVKLMAISFAMAILLLPTTVSYVFLGVLAGTTIIEAIYEGSFKRKGRIAKLKEKLDDEDKAIRNVEVANELGK